METHTLESSPDLSQILLAKKAERGGRPKQVGIFVAPTGDPAAPLVGAVTVDGQVIARTSLDAAGAAEFVSQAMLRVNETLPDARVQVAVEIDSTQVGPIVPTPPNPPHKPPELLRKLVALAADVFAFQHRRLAGLASRRAAPGRAKSPAPAKRVRSPDDHAGARRGPARGGAGASVRTRRGR